MMLRFAFIVRVRLFLSLLFVFGVFANCSSKLESQENSLNLDEVRY